MSKWFISLGEMGEWDRRRVVGGKFGLPGTPWEGPFKAAPILRGKTKHFPYEREISKTERGILENVNLIVKIGKIVHPEVRNRMNNFLKENKKKKFVVLDIPLLIENKINKKNDILIFVDAKKKEINKRLKKRPNFNLKIFNKLKKLQLSVEKKRKISDFIIKNNFKHNSTKKNVKKVLEKILIYAWGNIRYRNNRIIN